MYERLGLPFIEPTLREDRGELEAALAGELPDLITLRQIRGDLHTHTNLTDGLAPLERMLEAAAEHRYAYYAVTDHAPNLYMQRMTDEKMLDQRRGSARCRTGIRRCGCCTAPSSTSIPTVGWTGPRSSSTGSTSPSRRSTRTSASRRDQMTRRVIRAIEHPRVQHHRPPDHT